MKVAVFVDHDIICRHFISSGALSEIVRQADVVFVFPDDGGKRVKLDPASLPLGAPFVSLPINATRQITWRWSLFADQLKLRPGAHERAIRRLRWLTLGWKAATILTLASLPGIEILFKRWIARRLLSQANTELPAFLDREQPDVVLHPSVLEGVFINDLVVACSERHIPLVVAMNSWDNPSTKRAVVGAPDWLLVWGEQTRRHAERFIGMRSDRIIPFGAAQFDVHRDQPRQTREALAHALGIAPSNRILLFAGSNTGSDEIGTLTEIDDAISRGDLPHISLIYRPHPWGGGGMKGERLPDMKFRNVVLDPAMRDYVEALRRGNPGITLPDYRDTHDLLSAVDVVVSPMSTILLEATLHGKAVIIHDPSERAEGRALANGLPMLHFEEFCALPDVRITHTKKDLLKEIRELAIGSEAERRGRRLLDASSRFLAPHDQPWRERIVTFLAGVADKRAARRPPA